MREEDLYSEIVDIIQEETMYLRHFIGKIVDVNDPLKKGRVKVAIEELGFETAAQAIWCNPRQGSSLLIPKVKTYAEVYFINGDRSRPAFLYPASEILDNTPKNYKGNLKQQVLYEDQNDKNNNIKIDIQNGVLTLFDGTESFVLGNALLDWITDYIDSVFNVHVHPVTALGVPTGVSSVAGTVPSDILSDKIKGK